MNTVSNIGEPWRSRLVALFTARAASRSDSDRAAANRKIRAIRLEAARAKGTHTEDQWLALIARLARRCAKCGVNASELQKDHVMPIYQGGSDAIENLQPLCPPCNAGKGADCFHWANYRLVHGFKGAD
jgi:5-methylcytosine-specific restriction endonuclease McrA